MMMISMFSQDPQVGVKSSVICGRPPAGTCMVQFGGQKPGDDPGRFASGAWAFSGVFGRVEVR